MSRVRFAATQWARSLPTMLHNGRVDRLAHHLVLLVSTYANNDGTDACPSVRTLAEQAHADLADVEAALARLEAVGYLVSATGSMGRPGWTLDLSIRHDGDPVLESRMERRRSADRERKRRQRERQQIDGHGEVDRDVTGDSTVTAEASHVELLRDNEVSHASMSRCHATESVTSAGQDSAPPLTSLKDYLPISLTDASHDAAHRQDNGSEPSRDRLLTVVPDPVKPAAKKPRRSKLDDEYTPEFLGWWALYPRKADKFPAYQAFERVLSNAKLKVSIDILTEGVKRYAAEVAGRDQGHIKHGATWLNQRGWEGGAPVPVAEATLTATEWVRAEWKAGRVKPIEERTGLRYTVPDLPLSITGREAIEQFHANASREWIAANHDQIIERLTRRSAS